MTAPCSFCGAARSCKHRDVDPPRADHKQPTHGKKRATDGNGNYFRRTTSIEAGRIGERQANFEARRNPHA